MKRSKIYKKTLLVGDVGATKTHLSIVKMDSDKVEILAEKKYASAEFSSLSAVIHDFVQTFDFDYDSACFGIAGPVSEGKCEATNLTWTVDVKHLKDELKQRQALLINDLEASAWGIQLLKESDLLTLNKGQATAKGNACLIAAGTGLGEAGLYWDGREHRVFATEGGHVDFSPDNELETELLFYLKRKYQHVSWERILSGMGIENIHDFLREHRKTAEPGWLADEMKNSDRAAVISKAGMAGRDTVCEETLEMFVKLYAKEAGNLALKTMAEGGVYIGGGIAPKILPKLNKPSFIEAFCSKGRMEPLLSAMPVKLILNKHVALYGAALYAAHYED